jgi:hypothetical protein
MRVITSKVNQSGVLTAMSITLTGKEIVDLARFAGFSVDTHGMTDELETEYTVMNCPKKGLKDEDNNNTYHSKCVAYISDYQEEGFQNLGTIKVMEGLE